MSVRIVACDDDAHITRAISMKLRKAGFNVETGSDGQLGWEAIQRECPALLITDYQMPRLNGLELCRRLRENEATRDLPIILLTAKGFELEEEQLRSELGIVQLVAKPFSPRELLKMVESIVGEAAVSEKSMQEA